MSKNFLVGSKYFFSCYEDFVPHDIDEVELLDNPDFQHMRQITGRGHCYFQLRRYKTAQDYIDWAVKCRCGMTIGKFLVPEFAAEIGLSIEDLKQLLPLIERLDERHTYEKIIYDAYLINNAFILTNEQRLAAYQDYKRTRNLL